MEISSNICKVGEFTDAIYYDAICSCMADSHNQTLIVEHDKEHDSVNLSVYSKVLTPAWTTFETRDGLSEAMKEGNYQKTAYYRAKLALENIFIKLKFTFTLWSKGYIEVENQFVFRNEKAIEDYVFALTVAKEKMLLQKIKENINESADN